MTRIVVFALLVGIASSSAAAQTISVRSGEHDAFTRLVMKIPKGVDWSVENRDRSAKVKLDLPGVKFDTGQVFDRIPRNRLIGLTQSDFESSLALDLGCNCDVVGFTQSGGLLVIDVSDPSNLALATPGTSIPAIPYRFGFQIRSDSNRITNRLSLPAKKNENTIFEPQTPIDPAPPAFGSKQRLPVGISASEQRLFAQIVRAVDQGLVTPTVRLESRHDKTRSEGVGESHSSGHDSTGLSARTSIDRDMAFAVESAGETDCIPNSLVALEKWGSNQAFAEIIGEQRSKLFGEFDRLNRDSVEHLAKAYLHFGFGAEAQNVLLLHPSNQLEQSILHTLSAILDSEKPATRNPFSGQQHCKGTVSLWSVLAEPKLVRKANPNAVVQAFARLPPHLRVHLGPRLSGIFTRANDLKSATSILRAIDRTNNRPEPEQDLADARIDQAHGDPESAAQKMADVAASNTKFSPQALVDLVEMRWRSRSPIPPDLPELAAAYSVEMRRSELGSPLQRAHAISLALAGDFDAAFAMLGEHPDSDILSKPTSTLVPVLTLLTEQADDLTFLKYGLWNADKKKSKLPADLADKIARRLLDLGFPKPASSLLSSSGPYPVTSSRRLMRAEAAVSLSKPNLALVELLGLSDPDATRLRAIALWKSGDHQLASQAMLESEMIEPAVRGFWLGDTWDSIQVDDETKYGRIVKASSLLKQTIVESTAQASLAQSRTLLKDSELARETIDDLLNSVALNPRPE